MCILLFDLQSDLFSIYNLIYIHVSSNFIIRSISSKKEDLIGCEYKAIVCRETSFRGSILKYDNLELSCCIENSQSILKDSVDTK